MANSGFIPLESLPPTSSPDSFSPRRTSRGMSKGTFPSSAIRTTVLLGLCLAMTNLALSSTLSSRVYLFEQAVCRRYWSSHDETKIRADFSIEEGECKGNDVQSFLSGVVGVDAMLAALPGILVLATYRKLLPVVGVRYLLLLNVLCSALSVTFSTYVFYFHQSWDIGVAPLSFLFELLGGSEIVTRTLTFTCVAEVTRPEDLTRTYNYVSAALMATWVGGSVIGALMLSHHVWLLNSFAVLSYCSVAGIAMFIPHHIGKEEDEGLPPVLIQVEDGQTVHPRYSGRLSFQALKIECFNAFKTSLQDSFHVFRNLFNMSATPRNCLYLYLINYMAVNIAVLFPQYSSLVLTWPLAKVNGLLAFENGVSWFLLILLPTFRKCFLEPRMSVALVDLTIVIASFTAITIGLAGMGVSGVPFIFLTGFTIYNPWAGYEDSLRSFSTLSLAPTEKVSDLYVRIALVEVLSNLLAAPLWSFIFSIVLKVHLPLGTPLWICSAIFAVALSGASAMRKRQQAA